LPRYFESVPQGFEGVISFAGLTPGQIGLYQINVEVPLSLEIPVACGGETKSNTLAKLTTARGTLNLALCVGP
jgi:uncharacterized protein (TIGR03437 family)